MCTACFNSFSDGYIVGLANLTKFHGRKLATRNIMDLATLETAWLGLMTGPSDFVQCRSWPAPWLLKICIAYPLPSARPENAVAFPLIYWNDSGERLMFAQPALTELPCKLETQRS